MTAAVASAISDAVRSGVEAIKAPLTGSRQQSRSAVSLTAPTPNNIGQVRKLNSVLFPVRYSDKWYKDILKADNLALSRIGLYNDIPVGILAARYETASPSHPPEIGGVNIYLMTLGVLAPYRRRGLAAELLRNLLDVVPLGGETPEIGEDVVVHVSASEAVPTPVTELPAPATPVAASPAAPAAKAGDDAKAGKANGGKTASSSTAPAAAPTPRRFRYRVQAVYLHVQTSNTEARTFYESQGFTVAREIKEYYRKGVEPQSAWLLERRS
ncbi:N-acetyltransferase 5 [Tilletia horrida]|uniref:N-acetyltransferase 5 n=1 Tax=Tilletia horrida TaxID=155126 RepID=A0AAN6JNQ9_9BASI|nr:N-acetyltransferase 5 [Tilletia horrida]